MRGSIAKSLRRKAREEAEVRGFRKDQDGRKYMRARNENDPNETFIVVDPKSERSIFKRLKREVERGKQCG